MEFYEPVRSWDGLFLSFLDVNPVVIRRDVHLAEGGFPKFCVSGVTRLESERVALRGWRTGSWRFSRAWFILAAFLRAGEASLNGAAAFGKRLRSLRILRNEKLSDSMAVAVEMAAKKNDRN